MTLIAGTAFVAIFFLQAPFPLIVLIAGVVGYVGGRFRPKLFVVIKGHGSKVNSNSSQHPISDLQAELVRPSTRRAILVLTIGMLLWWGPIAALYTTYGPDNVYTQESIFFSKSAVVTFGGAYSVLAYIAQECVNTHHWLKPGEMLDGLGMAETTPGPLIQVVQFVGFMGAYRNPGTLSPTVAGLVGSLITTWVTFVPCFLWIFLGAPYIEYLRGKETLSAALSTITAAVVGVVLNLSIWFALHTLFGSVAEAKALGLRLLVPDWMTLDWAAAIITASAMVAMLRFKIGMIPTLAASSTVGLLWFVIAGN